jgi:hypothetical protein
VPGAHGLSHQLASSGRETREADLVRTEDPSLHPDRTAPHSNRRQITWTGLTYRRVPLVVLSDEQGTP